MRTWSDNPFGPTVDIADLPVGRILSTDDGESRIVYEIKGRSPWLAKLYKEPLAAAEAHALRRLIHLPVGLSAGNLAVVDTSIAWPVATVVTGLKTIGVVMAKAPDKFSSRLRNFSGEYGNPQPLVIDWLAVPATSCEKRGIKAPDTTVRSKAVMEFLRVGVLFDDFRLVYGDWSYKNAFWEQGGGAIFVIDMDTCRIGRREWIESPEWDDPLFPESRKPALNRLSDRYKLAVLVARCLTGLRRDPLTAHKRLVELEGANDFTNMLHQALTVKAPNQRPSPRRLLAAYQRSVGLLGANVSETVPIRPEDTSTPVDAAARKAGNVTGQFDLRARKAGRSPTRPPSGPSARAPTDGTRATSTFH